MTEELLINVTPQETRVAVIENEQLQELHLERNHDRGIVANIYKGKVVRVLPGMEAAFVDIDEQRTALLFDSDMHNNSALDISLSTLNSYKNDQENQNRPIQDKLHEGQKIIVQVLKDPLGDKGARLTTQLTIASRYLVFVPFTNHTGVSQKIRDPDTRELLQQLLDGAVKESGKKGGYIIRTVGESLTHQALIDEIAFLSNLWADIQKRIKKQTKIGLVNQAIPLIVRTIRDLSHHNLKRIRIDSKIEYKKARLFSKDIIPQITDKIEYYQGKYPIFQLFCIEDEINKALNRKVPLKSGGHLVIDQTEAMIIIDVNTGAFVGKHNMEQTVLKTNLEAIQALARQLKLRNLGGIIIIDFIDMSLDQHKNLVMAELKNALYNDRTKSYITPMSELGLVQITRKRTRASLEQMLCETCQSCSGHGLIKSPITICYEIFREIIHEAQQSNPDEFLIIASESVIDTLLEQEAAGLQALRVSISKPIHLQAEPLYPQELYKLIKI